MNRGTVIALLEGIGIPVVPWGEVSRQNEGRFCIVRPGGVTSDRNVVDVWIVNGPRDFYGNDPDAGLEEFGDQVYNLLRLHLLEPSMTPGSDYVPGSSDPRATRTLPRSTMLLTGSYPTARGIGQ